MLLANEIDIINLGEEHLQVTVNKTVSMNVPIEQENLACDFMC